MSKTAESRATIVRFSVKAYRIVGIQGEVSNYAEVTVNILPINDAPTFDLELNPPTLEIGSKIRLSAIRVNDVDSSRVTINWRQLSGPATHWNSVDTYSINIELRENIAVDQNIIFRAIILDNEGVKIKKRHYYRCEKSSY